MLEVLNALDNGEGGVFACPISAEVSLALPAPYPPK